MGHSDFFTAEQSRYLKHFQSDDFLKKHPKSYRSKSPNITARIVETKDEKASMESGNLDVTFSLRPVIRQEYRCMSEVDRDNFHKAILKLKRSMIGNVSRYDIFVLDHHASRAPAAHGGLGLLVWHREFLKEFELALQEMIPNIGLPYWDSSLDEGLPEPKDSIIWSEIFFGNSDGIVKEGPFRHWSAIKEVTDGSNLTLLWREVSTDRGGVLMRPHDLEVISNYTRFENFDMCNPDLSHLEINHGLVHVYVGGHMGDVSVSPADPIFYAHHAFIDLIWETFRQRWQTSSQRATEYPDQKCKSEHKADAQMKPFHKINKQGLREIYTSSYYHYDSRPICKSDGTSCIPDSEYLFCNSHNYRCMSKVRAYGNCSGLEMQKSCYNSICVSGICLP